MRRFEFRLAKYHSSSEHREDEERLAVCTILQLSTDLDRNILCFLLRRLSRDRIYNLRRLVEHALEQGYIITGPLAARATCLTEEPYWSICHNMLRSAMYVDRATAFHRIHRIYQDYLWSKQQRHLLYLCFSIGRSSYKAAFLDAPTLSLFWLWFNNHAKHATSTPDHTVFFAAHAAAASAAPTPSPIAASETSETIIARLQLQRQQQLVRKEQQRQARRKASTANLE